MPEWLIVVIRSTSLLFILFFFVKWLGKKQISQLNIFEYITVIVLGSIVALHSIDVKTNYFHGLLAMIVWFIIPFLVELISIKSKTFRNFFQGKGTVLIQNGKILEDNLKKEKVTSEYLLSQLRSKDIFQVVDVEFALMEPSGTLSVLPKKENQPLTPKDLGIKVAPMKETQTVIMDGKMLLEPLANASLNPGWLETELEKINVTIENVFLGQVDSYGQLTVDLYDDNIAVPSPAEKPLLLATMKKSQADLELFALATENEQSKQMYQKNSQKLQQAIDMVTPYLQ